MVLANAVQHVGQSVKIWLAAADLEHDASAKKRVLRKGIKIIEIYEYQLIFFSIQLSNIFPTQFDYGRRPLILNLLPPTLGFFSLAPSKLFLSQSNYGLPSLV